MSTKIILLSVILVVSMISMGIAGTVAADDWEDEDCGNIVDATGEYRGTIDSPEDSDRFSVSVDKGDYVSVRVLTPQEADSPRLQVFGEKSIENVDNVRAAGSVGVSPVPGQEASFEVWPEEDTEICFSISEGAEGGESAPYEWQINLAENDPEPATFDSTELREENSELQSEVDELESELSEAEAEIEEKDEEIEELEAQIEELEAELENAGVTIDVSVEPADQATFQAGSEMQVNIDSENTDPEDVTLSFAGEQYTPTNGQATIPLESSGTQDLSINYQDTTETVTLDVEDTSDSDASDNSDSDTTQSETSTSEEDVPGFGFGIAITALLSSAYLLQRRHNTRNN